MSYVLEKEKNSFWYAYEDDEFCEIFMHYYDKKNQHTRYRILCYLMAVMHYIHGAGFDEKIMIDHFGIDWCNCQWTMIIKSYILQANYF